MYELFLVEQGVEVDVEANMDEVVRILDREVSGFGTDTRRFKLEVGKATLEKSDMDAFLAVMIRYFVSAKRGCNINLNGDKIGLIVPVKFFNMLIVDDDLIVFS